jgi:hypothetical protein
MHVVIRLNLREVTLFLLFTVASKYRLSLPVVEITNAVTTTRTMMITMKMMILIQGNMGQNREANV